MTGYIPPPYFPPGYVPLERAIVLIARSLEPEVWDPNGDNRNRVATFLTLGLVNHPVTIDYPYSTANDPVHKSYLRAQILLRDALFLGKLDSHFLLPGAGITSIPPVQWSSRAAEDWLSYGGYEKPRIDEELTELRRRTLLKEAVRRNLDPATLTFTPVVSDFPIEIVPIVLRLESVAVLLTSKAAPAPIETTPTTRQLGSVVEALKKLHPNGHPPDVNRKAMLDQIKAEVGREVSPSTLDRARDIVWPRVRQTSSKVTKPRG